MRKIKSIFNIITLASVSLSLTFLCACSESFVFSKKADAAPVKEEVLDPVTLSVVVTEYSEASRDFWTGKGGFAESLKAAYPYIDLEIEVLPFDGLYEEMQRRINEGKEPDILQTDLYSLYRERGLLMLSDMYLSADIKSRLLPGYREDFGTPVLASARALYVNQDMVDRAGLATLPQNKDELLASMDMIKAANPDSVPLGIDISEFSGLDTFAVYTFANGGGFFDKDGSANVLSDANIKTFELLGELVDRGYCTVYADGASSLMREDFLAGRLCAIAEDQTFLKDCDGMNIKLRSCVTASENAANAAVCDYMCVFQKDDDKNRTEAIKKFFEHFYGVDVYSRYSKSEGFSPVTSDALSLFIEDKTDHRDDFAGMMLGSRPYPINDPVWMDIRQLAIGALKSFF